MTDLVGLPADILNSDGSTSVQTHHHIGATCGARWPRSGSAHLEARAREAALTHRKSLEHMSVQGHGPVLQLVRHRTVAKPPPGRRVPDEFTRSCPRSTTAGSPWAEDRRRTCSELSRRAGRSTGDGLRLLLRAEKTACVPLPPGRPPRPRLLRHRVSEAARDYIGIGRGSCRRRSTTVSAPPSPTPATTRPETKPGALAPYFGVDVFRGGLRLQRSSSCPRGALDVRGADAGAVSCPRRGVAAHLGPNHPRTVQAQIFHGMN